MRRSAVVTIAAALALGAPAAASGAEVVSLQAQAVNGGWQLPAPGQRAAVCLVDTGLDTAQLDVPAGVRLSTVAGISSAAPATGPDGTPEFHGTWMTQVSAAPIDGAGMIGSSPSVPLIMVRAMQDGTGKFAPADWGAGILQCQREANAAGWRLASVALALGGEAATSVDTKTVQQYVQDLPAVTVAAVGNRPGVPEFPASVEGVVGISSVSAVDGQGCPGAADADPEAGGVVGPGCLVTMPIAGQAQTVTSAGTSGASVIVAAAIAQLCDLAPSLTPRASWQLVQSTSRAVPGGRLPDLRAAAAAIGLAAPAWSAPLATLYPAGRAPAVVTPTLPALPIPDASVAPRWFGEHKRPKIRRLSRGRVQVTSPDKNRAAKLWTNLRGAKVGKRRTTIGRPRGRKVKVRVTQVVDGYTYKRTWTLKVPRKRKR